jgi:Amidohydrolase family
MPCEALLDQAMSLLQRRGRVTYRARKRPCTMPTIRAFLLLFALLALLLAQPSQPLQAKPLVFLHATVIDATGAPARSDMTVVITGSQINAIGETGNVRVPPEAQVIDATGKFVIPGLWDMHVHWYLKEYLPLFIANGVTGVRLMWGVPMHHAWRQEIEQGTLLGPRLVIASPIVDGPHPIWRDSLAVGNAAEAREAVRTAKQAGADFIKIYSRLPRDAFFAIVDETTKQGLRFAGHVPQPVSVVEAAEAGQHSIEHLSGILLASSTREDALRQAYEDAWAHLPEGERLPSRARTRPLTRMMLETFSPEKASALFAHFTRHHTWQTPTLTVLRSGALLDDPTFRHDPRLKYLPAEVTARWDPAADFRFKARTPEDFALARLVYQKQVELVGMMRRAGVELLAGTDVLNPYCFPGFSLHEELGLLVEAGLTPLEALQAATLNPARFLGKAQEFGTLEEGKRADLVLLDANPLEAISNTQKIYAVVVNGRLLDRAALDALLAQAEATAKQPGGVQPPLPDDVNIVAPEADVPRGVAAFSGTWAGQWGHTLDHVLVVEKIAGRNVTFIYSWGVAPAWNITRPGFARVTGTVDEGGILRGTLSNGAAVAYRLSQDQQILAGEYVLRGRTTLGSFTRQ